MGVNFLVILLTSFIFATYATQGMALGMAHERVGPVYEIAEDDLLKEILQRLTRLEEEGKIKEYEEEFKRSVLSSVDNPKGILLPRATVNQTHYFDPSIETPNDILLVDGSVLHPAGTLVNPLTIRGLSKKYIFIDANDQEQVDFAYEIYKESGWRDRVVLTNGSFKDVSNKWGKPVYFDQLGVPGQQKETLVSIFGINSLPSVVYQEGLLLRVDAVVINN